MDGPIWEPNVGSLVRVVNSDPRSPPTPTFSHFSFQFPCRTSGAPKEATLDKIVVFAAIFVSAWGGLKSGARQKGHCSAVLKKGSQGHSKNVKHT